MRGGRGARGVSCTPSGCPSALRRRIEAGTGSFIQNLLNLILSQRVPKPLFITVCLLRGRGSFVLRQQGPRRSAGAQSPGKGLQTTRTPVSCVF